MKISSLAANFSIENLLSKPCQSPTPPPNVSGTVPPIVPMPMFFRPFPAAMPIPATAQPTAIIFLPQSLILKNDSHSAPIHSLAPFNVPSSSFCSSSSSSSASALSLTSNAIGTLMGQNNNNNNHSSQQICTPTTTVTTALSTPSSAVFNQLNAMGSGKRKRRHRTIFTEDQLVKMEEAFIISQYPDVQMREQLADKLKMREERVEVWFKNRRAKERKKIRETKIK
ncbi:hypothetical protein niasHS_011604 [Heterodera schachtii]|uniref:Homeobox domain-containing protein n=1 Tax=Heterodera schachtii TaxID=97005 RepID=A0ABD2IJY7_HETSC